MFLGWEPHWMNVTYDIKYLKPIGKPAIAGTSSVVLTVVNPAMAKQYPPVVKFLTQFQLSKKTMSQWILNYGYKQEDPEDVAASWTRDNLDKVAKWLKGVQALDGKPATEVVKADLAS